MTLPAGPLCAVSAPAAPAAQTDHAAADAAVAGWLLLVESHQPPTLDATLQEGEFYTRVHTHSDHTCDAY